MEEKKEKIMDDIMPTKDLTENDIAIGEYNSSALPLLNAESKVVSVNAVRKSEADYSETEQADDAWLKNDDELYDYNANNASESDSNSGIISGSSQSESGSVTDDAEEIADEGENSSDIELSDENAPEDSEETDDDDYTPDEKKKKKKISAKKVGCMSCGVIFMLFILAVLTFMAAFYQYYRLMEIDNDDSIHFNDKVSFSDAELSEIPEGEVEIGEENVFKDKDVFNVLLIGTDERSIGFSENARADSIMILSLDNKTKKIKLVSLERGMLVSIPGRKNDILTHTFRYGGSNLLMETVRTHFKVDVEKYVRVNFSMFQELIDEIGGVDITLTQQEADGLNNYPNSNVGELDRQVFAGVNHFNGYEALQYSRLRSIDDDFHRIERQRKVIIAIKENMTDLSVADLKSIAEDCLPYVQTNLTAIEFADLLIRMPGYFNNEVSQMTIPKKGTYRTLGHVDFKENARILNEFLYVRKNNER